MVISSSDSSVDNDFGMSLTLYYMRQASPTQPLKPHQTGSVPRRVTLAKKVSIAICTQQEASRYLADWLTQGNKPLNEVINRAGVGIVQHPRHTGLPSPDTPRQFRLSYALCLAHPFEFLRKRHAHIHNLSLLLGKPKPICRIGDPVAFGLKNLLLRFCHFKLRRHIPASIRAAALNGGVFISPCRITSGFDVTSIVFMARNYTKFVMSMQRSRTEGSAFAPVCLSEG